MHGRTLDSVNQTTPLLLTNPYIHSFIHLYLLLSLFLASTLISSFHHISIRASHKVTKKTMAGEGSPSLLRLQTATSLIFLATATVLFPVTFSSDTDVLLQFKATLSGADKALPDWLPGSAPCIESRSNWTGVICEGGNVYGLQLENMKLSGTLDFDPLGALGGLRTLSFADNDLVGLMPSLDKVGALKALYLTRNKLSGVIPDQAFSVTMSLKKVHLSENRFSGPIPSSLVDVPKLLEVVLDGNEFSGAIPDLRQPGLKLFNVSDNNLEGPIPVSLSQMDASFFAGPPFSPR